MSEENNCPKVGDENTEDTNPVGRPTLYNDQVKEKILELAEKGKTNQQIADIIGVHVRTIENWQGKHKDLMWAIKEAKQEADALVEVSLFAKAVGYTHEAVKVFMHEGDTIEHTYQEHYPPDTNAAKFWLQNRQPEKWKANPEVSVTNNNINNTTVISDEDLDKKIQEKMEKLK